VFDAQQHHNPNDGWDAEKGKSRTLALCPGSEGCTSHGCYDLHGTKWDVEKDRIEWIEAEGIHNQRAKGCDATTGNSLRLKSALASKIAE